MKKMSQLNDLMIGSLKELYQAELHLIKVLPKFTAHAASHRLAHSLHQFIEFTEEHIKRLEKIFRLLHLPLKGKKCEAMEGLISQAQRLINEYARTQAEDAALVCAIQKIVHYAIATYGCAYTWANTLGFDEISEVLRECLEEEKNCDVTLTELAESESNIEAIANI
jgi:ferritin-like metal-binding protein YciE